VRVLRERRGTVDHRIDDAMKTGLTMTGTTLAVMVVVYVVSTKLTQIYTLKNIASVLLLGLMADLFTTWFTNAGILKWYLEKPGRRRGGRR
jgi:preprotein translocase subunit SecF